MRKAGTRKKNSAYHRYFFINMWINYTSLMRKREREENLFNQSIRPGVCISSYSDWNLKSFLFSLCLITHHRLLSLENFNTMNIKWIETCVWGKKWSKYICLVVILLWDIVFRTEVSAFLWLKGIRFSSETLWCNSLKCSHKKIVVNGRNKERVCMCVCMCNVTGYKKLVYLH